MRTHLVIAMHVTTMVINYPSIDTVGSFMLALATSPSVKIKQNHTTAFNLRMQKEQLIGKLLFNLLAFYNYCSTYVVHVLFNLLLVILSC